MPLDSEQDQPQGLQLTPREHYEKIPTRTTSKGSRRPAAVKEEQKRVAEAQEADSDSWTDTASDFIGSLMGIARSMPPSISQEFGPEPDLDLPKSVDLRDYLPTPGSQGDQNSCVAWAVAHATYSCQVCQERRRKRPTLKSDIFSPAFIYNELGKGNSAIYMPQVVDYVRQNGCASEATMSSNVAANEFTEAKVFRTLRHERANSLNDIKAYIYEGYPVVLVVRMGKKFRDENETSDLYFWDDDEPIGVNYHAIAAVGYDDDRDELLIMNSWGTEWKENGFSWIPYGNFSEINDRHWCAEAHVLGVKRIAPYNVWIEHATARSRFRRSRFNRSRFNRRVFQLDADRRVYEGDTAISPVDWQIDDIACNEDTLFVLDRDQVVFMMVEDGKDRKWKELGKGAMANKKVSMLAADQSSSLHALTSEHELMEYDTKTSQWAPATLPNGVNDIVDVRVLNGDVHATTVDGIIYVRDRFDHWRIEH